MHIRNGIIVAVAATVLAFSQGADAKTFKWAFQGDVATMDPHGLFVTMTPRLSGRHLRGPGDQE